MKVKVKYDKDWGILTLNYLIANSILENKFLKFKV